MAARREREKGGENRGSRTKRGKCVVQSTPQPDDALIRPFGSTPTVPNVVARRKNTAIVAGPSKANGQMAEMTPKEEGGKGAEHVGSSDMRTTCSRMGPQWGWVVHNGGGYNVTNTRNG